MVLAKAAIDKKQAIASLNAFFQQFQNCLNRPATPNAADFEKSLSRNFNITNNGLILAKSLQEYMNRIQQLQQKFSRIDINGPLTEPLISDNKLTISFDINVTARGGKKTPYRAMAIATIEDNKIAQWEQVAHEKNKEQWGE